MSNNNRYIGARYVPLFAGEWDNTAEYEPLMIVSYQGDSYTSKGYVPAGIDISNTTYWARTGNFNQQVANLTYRVNTVEQEMDTVVRDTIDNTEWTEIPLNSEQTAFTKATGCYIKYKAIGRLIFLAINLDVNEAFSSAVNLCNFPSIAKPDVPAFFGHHVVGFSGGATAILTATKSSPSSPDTRLTIIPTGNSISGGYFSTQIVYLTE